uniref:Uncharacterized protein n=1 Tax=Octopus bimaculoides TaxID=37653 RepID=A0A0L8GJ73_OCTBM
MLVASVQAGQSAVSSSEFCPFPALAPSLTLSSSHPHFSLSLFLPPNPHPSSQPPTQPSTVGGIFLRSNSSQIVLVVIVVIENSVQSCRN